MAKQIELCAVMFQIDGTGKVIMQECKYICNDSVVTDLRKQGDCTCSLDTAKTLADNITTMLNTVKTKEGIQ